MHDIFRLVFSSGLFLTTFIFSWQAHQWVKENMDKWVERYLVADNSPRVRGGKYTTTNFILYEFY